MAANLLATSSAENVPVELRFGFADRPLTGFFGIDGVTEAPSLVAFLGRARRRTAPGSGDVPGMLPQESNDLAAGAIDYPLSRALHLASRLRTHADVDQWQAAGSAGASAADELDGPGDGFRPLRSGRDGQLDASLDLAALPRRPWANASVPGGSTRRFAKEPISWETFRSIVDAAGAGIAAPPLAGGLEPYLRRYFIVHAVDGLRPPRLLLQPLLPRPPPAQKRRLPRRRRASRLEQALPADAAAVAFITADLGRGPARLRAARLPHGADPGRHHRGRIYLASHSLGWAPPA